MKPAFAVLAAAYAPVYFLNFFVSLGHLNLQFIRS